MRDTDYAFCVARIRANETKMLSTDFINRLIDSSDYSDAVRMLSEKGWMNSDDTVSQAVKKQSKELWTLLSESVPDKSELNCLCVLNDFFNIKTAVKCFLSGIDAADYYVYPTSLDTAQLSEEIKALNFDSLPGEKGECAAKAYDIAIKTENGQNADIIIDSAALKLLNSFAEKNKNKIFASICAFTVDSTNIKIAIRCANTGKNSDFAEAAISDCVFLDRDRLIKYCTEDTEKLFEYILSSDYAEGAELYKKSPAAYDKWCDDRIIDIIKDAKYTSFGFGPVCAYYYAKLTEIKTVRIVLTSKLSGVSREAIKERVRALYV